MPLKFFDAVSISTYRYLLYNTTITRPRVSLFQAWLRNSTYLVVREKLKWAKEGLNLTFNVPPINPMHL